MVLESHTGDVTRIDLQSRRKTRVATIETGLDNLVIAPDDRIFVSSFAHGSVWEIAPNGERRVLEPTGLIGPWGLACSGEQLFIADGPSLMRPGADGAPERVAWVGDKGFPGIIRDVCAGADGMLYVTTTVGAVASFHPQTHASETLASGLDRPNGVAGSPRGAVIAVESGTGRVLEIARAGKINSHRQRTEFSHRRCHRRRWRLLCERNRRPSRGQGRSRSRDGDGRARPAPGNHDAGRYASWLSTRVRGSCLRCRGPIGAARYWRPTCRWARRAVSRSSHYPESPGFFPDPSYPSRVSPPDREAGSM